MMALKNASGLLIAEFEEVRRERAFVVSWSGGRFSSVEDASLDMFFMLLALRCLLGRDAVDDAVKCAVCGDGTLNPYV